MSITVGFASPELQLIARDYVGMVGDCQMTLLMMQNNWELFQHNLKEGEPDLLIIFADVAPGIDALVDQLARLNMQWRSSCFRRAGLTCRGWSSRSIQVARRVHPAGSSRRSAQARQQRRADRARPTPGDLAHGKDVHPGRPVGSGSGHAGDRLCVSARRGGQVHPG